MPLGVISICKQAVSLCLRERVMIERLCCALPFSLQGHFLALPPINEEVGAVGVGCVCLWCIM